MRFLIAILLLVVATAPTMAQRRHRVIRRQPARVNRTQAVHAARVQAPRTGLARSAWVTVGTWTGYGPKTTEPFTIKGKKWRIAYSYTSVGGANRNLMQVILMHPGSSDRHNVAVNLKNLDGTTGEAPQSMPGTYNLLINCRNVDWTVNVEEFRG